MQGGLYNFHHPPPAFTETESVKSHASARSGPAYCFLKMPMKSQISNTPSSSRRLAMAARASAALTVLMVLGGVSGCGRPPSTGVDSHAVSAGETKPLASSIDPRALVLAPHTGSGRVDSETRRFQHPVR